MTECVPSANWPRRTTVARRARTRWRRHSTAPRSDRTDDDRYPGPLSHPYPTPTILGELKRHFRDRGWAVRPPRRVHDLYLNVQHAIDDLGQELRRSPTLPEIAERVCASVEEVVEALDAGGLRRSASLDARIGPDDDRSLTNALGAEDPE